MIENKYNLIDENWIPVAGKGKVSLKQIFSDFSITRLGGNPIEKISVFKLLLAIGQAAFTPKDEQEWKNSSPQEFSKKVLNYLDRHYNNFYLYGEKPFLQIPQIKTAKKRPYGDVQFEIATGNNIVVTETENGNNKEPDNAEKALLILVLMSFALGDKKIDNTIVLSPGYMGKTKEPGKAIPTSKPGPSMLQSGALHSFVLLDSIVDSVFLNLFSKEKLSALNIFTEGVGVPPWEKMPTGEDDIIARKLKKSYIGRLVPLSRFLLLEKDGLHYSEGILHPSYEEHYADLSMTVNFYAKQKPEILFTDPEKRPWRDLPALLSFLSNQTNQNYECQQIKNIGKRIENTSYYTVWSSGLKVTIDGFKAQKILQTDDFVESETKIYGESFGTYFLYNLTDSINELDNNEKKLKKAIEKYYKAIISSNEIGNKKSTPVNNGVNMYWQLCEQHCQKLIDACNDKSGEASKKMRPLFWDIVQQVYDQICPHQTARQLQVWAECQPVKYTKKGK